MLGHQFRHGGQGRLIGDKCVFEITLRGQQIAGVGAGVGEAPLQAAVVRICLRKRLQNRKALAVGGERILQMALCVLNPADGFISSGKVALPRDIFRIELEYPLNDGQLLGVRHERVAEFALLDLDVSQGIVRKREVELPIGIIWIGLCDVVESCERVAIGLQRVLQFALLHLCSADVLKEQG